MPNLVLNLIFGFIHGRDLKNLRIVCKRFARIVLTAFLREDFRVRLLNCAPEMLASYREIQNLALKKTFVQFDARTWIREFLGNIPFILRFVKIDCPSELVLSKIGVYSKCAAAAFPNILAIFPTVGVYFGGSIPVGENIKIKLTFKKKIGEKKYLILSAQSENINTKPLICAVYFTVAGHPCVVFTI
jgi:hypothetical protein